MEMAGLRLEPYGARLKLLLQCSQTTHKPIAPRKINPKRCFFVFPPRQNQWPPRYGHSFGQLAREIRNVGSTAHAQSHLTTHQSMLNYSCDSARPILHRPLGVGQFFDIIRLPGGRFKTMVVFLDSSPITRSLPS